MFRETKALYAFRRQDEARMGLLSLFDCFKSAGLLRIYQWWERVCAMRHAVRRPCIASRCTVQHSTAACHCAQYNHTFRDKASKK
jgi:hypothetical protein